MIKVREFAEKVGCSVQNIYLHMKSNEQELKGHIFKDGRFTLLDDFACDLIRAKMNPKMLDNNDEVMDELNRVRAALLQAGQKNIELATQITNLQGQLERKTFELENIQKALVSSTEEAQKQAEEIAKANKLIENQDKKLSEVKDDTAKLNAEKTALEEKLKQKEEELKLAFEMPLSWKERLFGRRFKK